MIREKKYVIMKFKDISKYLVGQDLINLNYISDVILAGRKSEGKEDIEAVVVESDWPMYEDTWKSIETWVDSSKENQTVTGFSNGDLK